MVTTEQEKKETRRSNNTNKLSISGQSKSSPPTSRASSPLTPNSPSTKYFPDICSRDSSPALSDDSSQKRKNVNKKSQCPCGQSSGGQSWYIPCLTCKQVWHNSCAGLKADFPKHVVDSLSKTWQCPWCFCCPFQRPQKHVSAKNDKELREKILTADIIQQITQSVAEVITQSTAPPTFDISGIQSQLDTLSQNIQDLRESTYQPPDVKPDYAPVEHTNVEPATLKVDCDEKPVSDNKTDYLTETQEENIKGFLKQVKESKLFKNKNGRSTISYGEHYTYSGSSQKPTSTEIPPAIKEVITKIAEDYNLIENQIPNSVLINHFPQKLNARGTKSSLPKHSDDEMEIEPDSSIFTYSVGGPRNIIFSGTFSDETEVHEAKPNSLYVMSRKSQSWYKHEILDIEACEERFSITMRHVNNNNRRSMLIIGDSNTKEIKFGAGVGNMGEKYPGKRTKAAKVHQIDPRECIGYSNVIISCGTNDLRPSEITGHPNTYIRNLVNTLRSKVEQINLLTQTKIFVMPVPPSRDPQMNKNIVAYNNYVSQSDLRARFDIWIPGLYSFLDRSGLLNSNLTRGGDAIHFGTSGICMFVRIIKDAIYQRERGESRGPWLHDTKNPTSGSRKPP